MMMMMKATQNNSSWCLVNVLALLLLLLVTSTTTSTFCQAFQPGSIISKGVAVANRSSSSSSPASASVSSQTLHHRHPSLSTARIPNDNKQSQQGNPRPLSMVGIPDDSASSHLPVDTTDSNSNSNSNSNAQDSMAQEANNKNLLTGRGLLCVVALLYGTLTVSLRMVYQLPDPPTAAALSASRGWLATLCFLPLVFGNSSTSSGTSTSISRGTSKDSGGLGSNSNKLESTTVSDDDDDDNASSASSSDSLLSSAMLWAGLELAVWNFMAQGFLNVGLLSTGSARASFLTQTSVVLTPIISLLFGQKVPNSVWMGCGVALIGLTLLSGGGAAVGAVTGAAAAASTTTTTTTSGFALSFSSGDWLVLGGALSWSMYLFRLDSIGAKFKENVINLQFLKTSLLAVLYSIWFVWSYTPGVTSMTWIYSGAAWAALFYSALGPGMVADVLQQKGQSKVGSASEANVLLSMEPVFAAVCARLLLGEITTLPETIGGGLILLAALIATR